jgi:hypothetical protein
MTDNALSHMPILCWRCNRRANELIVSVHGDVVSRCVCGRLWNRSKGEPATLVFYYTDNHYYRLVAGEERATAVKDAEILRFLRSALDDTRARNRTVPEALDDAL